jgi:hypothetical protein
MMEKDFEKIAEFIDRGIKITGEIAQTAQQKGTAVCWFALRVCCCLGTPSRPLSQWQA